MLPEVLVVFVCVCSSGWLTKKREVFSAWSPMSLEFCAPNKTKWIVLRHMSIVKSWSTYHKFDRMMNS